MKFAVGKHSEINVRKNILFEGWVVRIGDKGFFVGFEAAPFWRQHFWIAPVQFIE